MIRKSRRERGTALVLVLLVTLLVTVIAVSLLFVTDIERQLGANERIIHDNYFLAEAGIHAALASAVVTSEWSGARFATVDRQVGGRQLGHRVVTTAVQAIGPAKPPPMTLMNEDEDEYYQISAGYHVVAQRVSWPTTEPAPLYRRSVPPDPREEDVVVQASTSRSLLTLLVPIKTPPPRDIYDEDRRVELGLEPTHSYMEYDTTGGSGHTSSSSPPP
jgi:hypothetical protein